MSTRKKEVHFQPSHPIGPVLADLGLDPQLAVRKDQGDRISHTGIPADCSGCPIEGCTACAPLANQPFPPRLGTKSCLK